MSNKQVLFVLSILWGLAAGAPAYAFSQIQTCVAINEAHLDAGYLFSSDFEIVDPQARELASKEWERFAASKGFESVGCDQQHYADEIAALPRDTKIIKSEWKPSRDAQFAGKVAIDAGKRNFRNGSQCIQVSNAGLVNKCEYPVSVAFCFQEPMSGSGNSYDRTCAVQKFGTLLSLAAGEIGQLGKYQHVFYFACEKPAEPVGMQFDGSGLIGVCTAP